MIKKFQCGKRCQKYAAVKSFKLWEQDVCCVLTLFQIGEFWFRKLLVWKRSEEAFLPFPLSFKEFCKCWKYGTRSSWSRWSLNRNAFENFSVIKMTWRSLSPKVIETESNDNNTKEKDKDKTYLILIVYNDSRLGSFRFHPILLISNPDAIGKSIPGQDRNKRWRHSALTEAVNHESSDLQVHCQGCTITIRRQSFKEFA